MGPSTAAHAAGASERKNSVIAGAARSSERRARARAKATARRKRQREEEELGDEAPPRKEPKTIEMLREFDDSTGKALGAEAARAIEDEFSPVLSGAVAPTLLITTAVRAGPVSFQFAEELLHVFTDSVYYERKKATIAQVSKHAADGGFSDVIILKEDKRKITSLIHAHLPDGPTAIYKVTSYVPSKDIRGHGRSTRHTPEVLLNNFSTELGVRVGRMLASLFPHSPDFVGRQAATFHSQRDFIFFRFHRYVFNSTKSKARLQELGPRFTLKLQQLQKGSFVDPEKAENEFQNTTKKDVQRRKFFL